MCASTAYRKRRVTIHEKLAIEFHEHKLKYLKEHEMEMKMVQVELEMKIKESEMQWSHTQKSI